MITNKTYKGTLNIDKTKIFVDTSYNFRTIEINYINRFKVRQINRNNIKMLKGNGKILIKNLGLRKLTNLFEYKGLPIFTKCVLTDTNRRKHNLYINRLSLETWDKLSGTLNIETNEEILQTWEGLTRFYEDLDFDGNNDRKTILYKQTYYDFDDDKFKQKREIRKK
tara:strand:+ start:4345 stop:4845 length:501 start_codon:yes stop_codon:yes gene_type:complete